jgi:hypothetical protein
MKKVVTLLITVAAFGSSFAQSNDMEEARRIVLGERKDSRSSYPNDPRDVVLGSDERRVYDRRDDRYPNRYPTTSRSRTEQINREYDTKIRSIRNNPHLSSAEKERIIRGLNNERARRIREVNGDYRKYQDKRRYEDRRYDDRRYDRRDDDDDYKKYKDKKHKGNNGNHYGWQKGKGNPHKHK